MMRASLRRIVAVSLLPVAVLAVGAAGQDDPYERYIRTSKDFQRVKQDADWLYNAFPSWTNMPWPTGTWRALKKAVPEDWFVKHGYNGAAINRGNTWYLDWIDKYRLRFYVDHAAGKYDLLLHNGTPPKSTLDRIFIADMRIKPVNAKLRARLHGVMKGYIPLYKSTPWAGAYALDDEISWGHFIYPAMWRITDDETAYPKWLAEIYGRGNAPRRERWVTYEEIWPKLSKWRVRDFDVSALMDQLTFNDSYWNNFIGELVEYANELDPRTPCGFVGGQSPNAFGGYDYAKVMRKVQYIESYNLGNSLAVIRSLNPKLAIPSVTTHFHSSVSDSTWQTYYYLAHGNRGFIGWPDKNWFTGGKPTGIHAALAPHYKEAATTLGPLMSRAEWIHDGVAILYNHASIQMSWIMDAEPHKETWKNRRDDYKLGLSHQCRAAWINMLRDSGLQYNFIDYVDVVRGGVPADCKVLILPAMFCLSDAEAGRIREFVRRGGTVIADFLPGLWDQHGRPRPGGGALDDLFGLKHSPDLRAKDVFGETLWTEVDQDVNYRAYRKSRRHFLTSKNTCVMHASGFNKAVREMGVDHVNTYGRGKAVLMNLSPQWYTAYRQEGFGPAKKREVFTKHVLAAVKPWVRIKGAGGREFGHEFTYFSKGGRTIVWLCFAPAVKGSSVGGGRAATLKTDTIGVTVRFAGRVRDVRDERTGKPLGDGQEFKLTWTMNQAVVLSFAGRPPR